MNLFSAKIEIEGHILRANNAMNTLQHNLDLLIDSVINAQKMGVATSGNLPSHLDGSINKEGFCFPKIYCSTFPLSKESARLLLRLCELKVYIKNGILGYVILLPLVNRGNFNIYIYI